MLYVYVQSYVCVEEDNVLFRYWRPGPRATPIQDTKYTTYGFAHIQDMVDHAIIRLQTNITQEVGVILQQFPYPCWIKDRYDPIQ